MKYMKVYIFRKEILQGIYVNDQKSPNISQSHLNTCNLGSVFSLFRLISYFLKILAFLAQKTEILAKKWFFGFFGQNFQKLEMNQKSEKSFPRYMYVDGFGKFLEIFVQIFFFFTLVQKNLGQKNIFLFFFQNYDF